MIIQNPLVSREGFQYLYRLSRSGNVSRESMDQVLSSLVMKNDVKLKDAEVKKARDRKELRKFAQFQGVMDLFPLFGNLSGKLVTEIGCGSGELAYRIAQTYPDARVLGIDLDEELMANNIRRYGITGNSNLEFFATDAFSAEFDFVSQVFLSLHGCGNLTDRATDLALQSKADVLVVPCCYPQMKTDKPRSESLRGFEKEYLEALNSAIRTEGSVNDSKPSIARTLREVNRTLVNIDRLLYMQEQGYQVGFAKITGSHVLNAEGRKVANSSLATALIGLNRLNHLGQNR